MSAVVEVGSESSARLLEGRALAERIREEVRGDIVAFREESGVVPRLAVVLVGPEAPSSVYLQQIVRSCARVGAEGLIVELSPGATARELRERIEGLNADTTIHGIIVQMPLPPHIPLPAVIDSIDPRKDVDGIHPHNAGLMELGFAGFLPATAYAAVEILRDAAIPLEGLDATVIGRSNVVGKPAALLLMREHCTVTICHRRTRDLVDKIRRADLVVVAAGSPRLVHGSMLKPGAIVVDIGINVVPEGIVGDVDFASASRVASAITPVPGGVGPVTNAILMRSLLAAARALREGARA